MRLWTLHPRYLDPQGLVALWREGLLAQRVLQGGTRGYRNHPQLHRFRDLQDPLGAICSYLGSVHAEAVARGYGFDSSLISTSSEHRQLTATSGQLRFEAQHLRAKLSKRSPSLVRRVAVARPDPHPLFRVVPGPREAWERAASGARGGA